MGVPMETMNRNQVIQEISQLLSGGGFETSQVYYQSCFDMAARKKITFNSFKSVS